MALNVVSNFAANVAHRNLTSTDADASASLAKLSIGKRVVSARDDAASMAIGSRMSSEVQGLKQAVVNAGQANSMLQIADGAMSTVSDILTRMKTLAVQSSSGNLSDTERAFLDVEFQNLVSEVDRVAEDTEFNGTQLLDGSLNVATEATNFTPADGVAAINAQGISTGGGTFSFSVAFDSTSNTFTVTVAGGATYAGAIDASIVDTNGATDLSRATTVTLEPGTAGTADGQVTIALNTAFDTANATNGGTGAFSGSDSLSLSFKLGTGTSSEDSLSFTLNAVDTAALGLTGQTIDTEGNANSALEAVNGAIDSLNEFRADVGAAQNRLDFAADNLRVSMENAEAARSTLLDLDIAAEMTNFTSKQVLMQSGVAMLAQANQMPQNLLRLLQ